MNCVGSVGLLGSWYFIWATRSFRNVSWSIWSSRLTEAVAVEVAADPVPLTGELIVVSLSGEHVHALRRGRGGGDAGRPARIEVVAAQPRAGTALAAALLPVLALLARRLLLRRPRAARVPGDVEAVAAEAGALQVAAQVRQRVEQRRPAVLVGAAQGQVDGPGAHGDLHVHRAQVVGREHHGHGRAAVRAAGQHRHRLRQLRGDRGRRSRRGCGGRRRGRSRRRGCRGERRCRGHRRGRRPAVGGRLVRAAARAGRRRAVGRRRDGDRVGRGNRWLGRGGGVPGHGGRARRGGRGGRGPGRGSAARRGRSGPGGRRRGGARRGHHGQAGGEPGPGRNGSRGGRGGGGRRGGGAGRRRREGGAGGRALGGGRGRARCGGG